MMCLVFVGLYNCFYNCFYDCYTVLMFALLVANKFVVVVVVQVL